MFDVHLFGGFHQRSSQACQVIAHAILLLRMLRNMWDTFSEKEKAYEKSDLHVDNSGDSNGPFFGPGWRIVGLK